MSATPKFLTPTQATAVVKAACEWHRGTRPWPPDILAKRKEIDEATRNAVLFFNRMNTVDYGMVETVTRLRNELDILVSRFAMSEAG